MQTQTIKKASATDFLNGTLWKQILFFTLPIAATNILQQLFNTADIAVVGQLAGNDALAAVGCTGPIVNLFISLLSGLAIGANAIISRYLGAQQEQQAQKTIHASIAVALVTGLLLTILCESVARPLLVLVSTPADVLDLAVLYLRIYFSGCIFLTLYNFEAAILRSGGDTKTPVLVLACSGVVNILLNLFFVLVCGMSVDGVALATLISNILNAVILFCILLRREDVLRIRISEIRLHGSIVKSVLWIGIPAALQGMLFNIANIVIQSGVNSLGAVAVAGSTVGLNIEIFAYYLISGFGQASITFNSQNLGAGNLKRCTETTRWCLIMGFIAAAAASLVMVVFRNFLAGLFTPDKAVIAVAAIRVVLIAGFEAVNMVIEVLSGSLRGLGSSVLPAVLTVFLICGVRIVWLFWIFPLNPTFQWLLTIYPISWFLAAGGLTCAYFAVKKKVYASA